MYSTAGIVFLNLFLNAFVFIRITQIVGFQMDLSLTSEIDSKIYYLNIYINILSGAFSVVENKQSTKTLVLLEMSTIFRYLYCFYSTTIQWQILCFFLHYANWIAIITSYFHIVYTTYHIHNIWSVHKISFNSK